MNVGRLRLFGPASSKKDRDEDLALFRELFKREREMNTNLLESVSTELLPVEGNSVVYKISTGRKGDFPGNEREKNDYDWLKTPPATPLFQSLEMDMAQANNTNIIVHKELPIPPLKPSRFSEKMEEPNQRSKSPSSWSVASLASTSSSRPQTPDPKPLQTPKAMTTPRFTAAQRFKLESNTEASAKPLGTPRFSSKKEEAKPRPKSPGTLSTASSRPVTPDVNPKPPSSRRTGTMARGKGIPKPIDRSTKMSSKEATDMQNTDPKLQTRKLKADMTNLRPADPISRSVKSTAPSSQSENPGSNPELESKGHHKSSAKPIIRSSREAISKAPSNLTNSSAAGSKQGVSHRALSAMTGRKPTEEVGGEQKKGNEKRGGINNGMVIGSSMVEKMMNARRSTAMGKVAAKEEKTSKMRGL